MNKQLSGRIEACSEYQRLVEESQSALEIWSERRTEVRHSRLSKKEEGDELLRLQANFARAYAFAQRHSQSCLHCQLVSGIERRDSENGSGARSDSTLYA